MVGFVCFSVLVNIVKELCWLFWLVIELVMFFIIMFMNCLMVRFMLMRWFIVRFEFVMIWVMDCFRFRIVWIIVLVFLVRVEMSDIIRMILVLCNSIWMMGLCWFFVMICKLVSSI